MSKTALWVVIGVAALVVVALAVLTPTVIADDEDGYVRVARVSAPAPAPEPSPFRRGLFPDLRRCLERHGFGQGSRRPPSLDRLRDALKDCAPFRR